MGMENFLKLYQIPCILCLQARLSKFLDLKGTLPLTWPDKSINSGGVVTNTGGVNCLHVVASMVVVVGDAVGVVGMVGGLIVGGEGVVGLSISQGVMKGVLRSLGLTLRGGAEGSETTTDATIGQKESKRCTKEALC